MSFDNIFEKNEPLKIIYNEIKTNVTKIEKVENKIIQLFNNISKDNTKNELESKIIEIDKFVNKYKFNEHQLAILELKKNVYLNNLEILIMNESIRNSALSI